MPDAIGIALGLVLTAVLIVAQLWAVGQVLRPLVPA